MLRQFIISVVALGVVLSANMAFAAWQGPPTTGTPPTNCTAGYPGCDSPLNVSLTTQTKQGTLTVGAGSTVAAPRDLIIGNNTVGNTIIRNGSIYPDIVITPALRLTGNGAGANKILTSDASGNATWKTPSGGGGPIATQFFSVVLPNGSQRIAPNSASLKHFCEWKGYQGYTGASPYFEGSQPIYTWNGSSWVYGGEGKGITFMVCYKNL